MDIWNQAQAGPEGFREFPAGPVPADPKLRLIDARNPDEFNGELGHIDGAELVPLPDVVPQSERWDPELTYLLICRSGRRSQEAARSLLQLGFTRLLTLTGGMMAYREAEKKP